MDAPIDEDGQDLPAVLRDVLGLARRGEFSVASRRFGDLRLEDGRHCRHEVNLLRAAGVAQAGMAERLACSRARLLRLEEVCAVALERAACAEYEAAAGALEQELLLHAALERRLTRHLQRGQGRRADRRHSAR